MDTELLKTFLEVTRTRHFGRAADNLFLTQSAVSFRIRHLESQLDNALFSRQRGNVQLTSAGERLLPYAESILQIWGQARNDIALAEDRSVQLTLGASSIFWEFTGISTWINRIASDVPELALQLESVSRQNLSKRIIDKNIDLLLTSEQLNSEQLICTTLQDYQLQLVSHKPDRDMDNISELGLIYLDWSTRVSAQHNKIPALHRSPVLHTDSCKMALNYLLDNGGVAYLPSPIVASALANGSLYLVADAPTIPQTLYLLSQKDNDKHSSVAAMLAVPMQLG